MEASRSRVGTCAKGDWGASQGWSGRDSGDEFLRSNRQVYRGCESGDYVGGYG